MLRSSLTFALSRARNRTVPPLSLSLSTCLSPCRRGKALQKHYTVILATIPGADRAAYRPRLNDEHTEWRWLDLRHAAALAAAPGAAPHQPTGRGFLGDPDDDGAVAAAAGPPQAGMLLHPVVRVLFGGAHAEALGRMLAAAATPAEP